MAISGNKWKYDVFLSFRGEDTRGGFTDHLYKSLTQHGISTFRDEEEIDEGSDISSDLADAIQRSRFALVVVSQNYAASRWCLAELAEIFRLGITVLPVFYKVDPSHVRNHRGSFGNALAAHELRFGKQHLEVREWRRVLTKLANLKAWLSQPWSHETKVIEEIIEALLKRIKPTLTVTQEDQLVGINHKLNKLLSLLGTNSNDQVVWVGIHGMGGIGKTTIARACYERIHDEFEAHCFLSNVRETSETSGLPHLQRELLLRTFSIKNNNVWDVEEGFAMITRAMLQRKTLLVLDDVDSSDQIMGLIPNKDSFGNDSRIIITTRNADLLSNEFNVKRMFKMEELKYEEALQLFNLSAFMKTCPKEGFFDHSKNIVELVGGHPLALKLLGSSLRNKDLNEWKCKTEELQRDGNTNEKIFKCLKVSYDGLDVWEKEIFLDVACFFKGKKRELVEEMLHGCGFYAKTRVELLIQKSLLTLSYGKQLQMHDLLQEMGQRIVRQKEYPNRLWFHKDIKSVVPKALVQSMFFKSTRNIVEVPILFSTMHHLRLLNFHNVRLANVKEYCIPTELRYLKWKAYPLEFLSLSSEEYKLIGIHMSHSNLKQFWHGEKNLEELKYIKLNHSKKLSKTPNFAQTPNLTRLELEGCTSLVNIHPSIFAAEKLIFLNLKDCIKLSHLPSDINIKALEVLILSGCSKVKKIPEFSGNTNRLLQLHLDGTSISNLPSSVASLNHLTELNLENCKMLTCIPNVVNKMTSLQSLDLCGCTKLGNRKRMANEAELEDLDIRGTAIKKRYNDNDNDNQVGHNIFRKMFRWFYKAPTSDVFGFPSLAGMHLLVKLNLKDCNLEGLPEGMECLVSLTDLNLCGNSFSHLPTSISRLVQLRYLNISQCRKLLHFPELPPRIFRLVSNDCISLKNFPDNSKVQDLNFMGHLNLLNCYQLVHNEVLNSLIPSWLDVKTRPASSPKPRSLLTMHAQKCLKLKFKELLGSEFKNNQTKSLNN